jgi:hypothetical protein
VVALVRGRHARADVEDHMSSFHPTPRCRPLLDQHYDFGIVPGGTPIPFSAALLAFRLLHAVFMPDVTVAMIQGQVA